jgi:two-component system cell cycle sensor histidine kinase/response regulator CckA
LEDFSMANRPTYEELEKRVEELEKEAADVSRSEKALLEAHHIKQLLGLAPYGIFLIDLMGMVIFCNESGANRLGKTSKEIEGTHLTDYFPQDVAEERQSKGIEAINSKGPIVFEDQIEGRSYSNRIHPVLDKKGEVTHLAVYGADITEIKDALEASRESEERFRAIFEQAAVGVGLVETETGRFLRVNQKYCDIVGCKQEEMSRITFMEITHLDDLQRDLDNIQRLIRGEIRDSTVEKRYIRKDGSSVWVSLTISPMWGVDERPNYHIAVVQDITNRKNTERALRESEEKYRNILKNMEEGYYEVDLAGNLTFFNEAMCRIGGYTRDELMGMNNRDYMDPETAKRVYKTYNEVYRTGRPAKSCEYEGIRKDGTRGYIEISASLLRDSEGKPIGFRGIVRDVTQRKQAERELQESEARYRQLVKYAPTGIVEIDLVENRFTSLNDLICEYSGYTREELLSMPPLSIFSEDSKASFLERVGKILAGEEIPDVVEYKIKARDGREICVLVNSRIKFDNEGKAKSAVGIIHDITERKQAEEALRESEEKYRELVENINDGIYSTDESGVITYISPGIKSITGYSAEEVIGRSFTEFIHEEDLPRIIGQFEKILVGQLEPSEYKVIGRSGEIYWVRTSSQPIYEGSRVVGLRGVMVDITESKRLEAKLRQAQKMEALGLMAGGIAHDLNNILSGLVGYPDLLLMDLPQGSPLRNPLEIIKESGQRAADVVADLLTIARGVAATKEVLNLNTIVEEYLHSPEHKKLEAMHPSVIFKTELDIDLLNTSCSPVHIKKTLMNLVTNASEAIEGMGTVRISTLNQYLDEPLKGYEDVRIGEYAVLSVSDDGTGISREDLERIFEPFYTKKIMGRRGTGLGLAVVWNTVQDHNGYINVKTSERGTVFELYFPVTREEVASKREEVHLEDYLGHGEKMLVVDDEQRQRM